MQYRYFKPVTDLRKKKYLSLKDFQGEKSERRMSIFTQKCPRENMWIEDMCSDHTRPRNRDGL